MAVFETPEELAWICEAFLKKHNEHRSDIRKKSRSAYAELLVAHQLAFSAIVSYQERIQGKPYEAKEEHIKGRMSLIAQFIQGIDITETAISEGLYANAANLLKQELETLAAIEEYVEGNRRDRETPKFKGRLNSFGRRYGEFNDISHPTKKDIVERLTSYEDGKNMAQLRYRNLTAIYAGSYTVIKRCFL